MELVKEDYFTMEEKVKKLTNAKEILILEGVWHILVLCTVLVGVLGTDARKMGFAIKPVEVDGNLILLATGYRNTVWGCGFILLRRVSSGEVL
jgi:hypothetical protein